MREGFFGPHFSDSGRIPVHAGPYPRVRLMLTFRLGLLFFGISFILKPPAARPPEADSSGTSCPNSCRALVHTSLVELSRRFIPCLRTSRAIFFILPRIFLSPYAAAFFVVTGKSPNRAPCKISRPSSYIQDKLKAARRLLEASDECNCSRNFPRRLVAASSCSRSETSFLSDSIMPALNIQIYRQGRANC